MKNTQMLVKLSMFSSIAFILMLLNFPLPFLPDYLKIDFSDVPALLAAILFSPMAGVVVEALKNVLYYLFRGSGIPIGELSNFIAGCAFILPVSYFYHKRKSKNALAKGLISGTITMALLLVVLNYFLILPAYAWFFGMDYMLDPAVKWYTAVAFILPFNVIKGLFITALFLPLFIKLKPWIQQNQVQIR
ncbi:ECF transporter S component [Jeotgalibacillus sp. ET6]|uniref:ECF transporter S component n=1 Tax=Jeotgalibacillus sp. ET6 TaxID=3037260 RepID=UPI0024189A98|nr:ECF transporter S component [Jeotgalibacillus sp. ET6]MDG5472585.1 ECF transporter S component [Jeotgalibacillus sp. ET6]